MGKVSLEFLCSDGAGAPGDAALAFARPFREAHGRRDGQRAGRLEIHPRFLWRLRGSGKGMDSQKFVFEPRAQNPGIDEG